MLENVVFDPASRALNLDDDRFTENTRAAYPISFIDNAAAGGIGGHPKNIVMLTADAFGVLPPIARLTPQGAMYHFLSGYTAKVAGTEKGVTEPSATFSTCFGAPFLPLPPSFYARMLGDKIAQHQSRLARQHEAGARSLRHGPPHEDRLHARDDHGGAVGLPRPRVAKRSALQPRRPGDMSRRPGRRARPRNTWTKPADYDAQAAKLAKMFVDNFKNFEADVTPDVKAAGPKA